MSLPNNGPGGLAGIQGALGALVVTPSDSVDLPRRPTRGLVIGVAGNIKVTMVDGDTLVIPVTAGDHSYHVTRVWSTSTTATGIVALY